jgi:hypothetical protein
MKKILFVLVIFSGLIACKSNDKKTTDNTSNLSGDNKNAMTDLKNSDTSHSGLNATDANAANTDNADFTTIQWLDSSTLKLGKLKKGNSVEITFRFKNTGTKNLIIENVTAQCGCTIPEKPERPFAPGEEGIIKAKFNGSGSGTITKQVYVTANTNPSKSHTLTFTGDIIE